MPSRRQHEENERDCRTIVQQLVSSIPHVVLTSTSYGQKEQGINTRRKTVTFVDQDKEGVKVERNVRVQDCLSGETNKEKSQRVQEQHSGQGSLSGESEIDEKVPDEKQDQGEQSFVRGVQMDAKKGTKKLLKKWRGPFMITEVHQEGRF